MKYFFIIITMVFGMITVSKAQRQEVTLVNDNRSNSYEGSRYEVPPIKVEDGDDEVTITSDSPQTVGVVIRGTDGSLMYVGVVNASKTGTSIYIPSSTLTDKFTIDIYTDDRHLTGLKYYTPSLRMEL